MYGKMNNMNLRAEKAPGIWAIQDEKWEKRNMPDENENDLSFNITELTYDNFDAEISASANGKLVVVDCTAPWCKVCDMVFPIFKEIAKEYKNKVKFCILDVEKVPRLTDSNGIKAIPTVLFIQDRNIVERVIGLKKKQDYIDIISKYFDGTEKLPSDDSSGKRCIDFNNSW